jgi:hypothetical protein
MAQKTGWTPWHKVVSLRPDLRSGDLVMNQFAADLYEAVMREGTRPIYENPDEFFALTFPTHNLRLLAGDVCKRLLGESEKAVRQLQLTYGGGKTHTLITLLHLVREPEKLPDLPAVKEFSAAVCKDFPKARVAALCFDKIDPLAGQESNAPNGDKKRWIQPWSILAWQIAGSEGIAVINPDNPDKERNLPPAENLMTKLFRLPRKDGLSLLILVDEVLMYARSKVAENSGWRDHILNFFQYMTQATAKVEGCCLVASLLASDPSKEDLMGRGLQGELYDIFQRQREEVVEPVSKDDVAEVLRRRFFTPESIREPEKFRSHVQEALKGIADMEGQNGGNARAREERYYKSYPFHPDLTDIFYTNWTQLPRFQKTRGALRTFALALRDAETWDQSPLVSAACFLADPKRTELSAVMQELVAIADNADAESERTSWAGIVAKELEIARSLQREFPLGFREIEQAALATFLHSLPLGREAKTHELLSLIAPTRPDKITLERGLAAWAERSFWLDDQNATEGGALAGAWRLGRRPNLTQMHSEAKREIGDDDVRARLLSEIAKNKALTLGARESGLALHVLPESPRDVADDGNFHYVVLGPDCASEPGNIAKQAARYLEEGSSPGRPRVYKNALILLTPSRDGLDLATARLRDAMAWGKVLQNLRGQGPDTVDPVRMSTLTSHRTTADGKVPDAVKQAWCMVVTFSEKGTAYSFKLNVGETPQFAAIKQDKRSRVFDTALNAEALLPGGPYDLWHEGDKFRRVKDLYTAFAQYPHLPKMLRTKAVVETLAQGCEDGILVLRLARPDGSFRVWWRFRPDSAALDDAELELWLPQEAELTELEPAILRPDKLPGLWPSDNASGRSHITVKDALDYFSGGCVVQWPLKDYTANIHVPKATRGAIWAALGENVENGAIWLYNPPASVLAEPVPAGVLTDNAKLYAPPSAIGPIELLSTNLPYVWQDNAATVEAIAAALSQKAGLTLPWKTIRDAVDSALNQRLVSLDPLSPAWPCPPAEARNIRLCQKKEAMPHVAETPAPYGSPQPSQNLSTYRTSITLAELQDAADIVPELLRIQSDYETEIKVDISFVIGKEEETAPNEAVEAVRNAIKTISRVLTKE